MIEQDLCKILEERDDGCSVDAENPAVYHVNGQIVAYFEEDKQ